MTSSYTIKFVISRTKQEPKTVNFLLSANFIPQIGSIVEFEDGSYYRVKDITYKFINNGHVDVFIYLSNKGNQNG